MENFLKNIIEGKKVLKQNHFLKVLERVTALYFLKQNYENCLYFGESKVKPTLKPLQTVFSNSFYQKP